MSHDTLASLRESLIVHNDTYENFKSSIKNSIITKDEKLWAYKYLLSELEAKSLENLESNQLAQHMNQFLKVISFFPSGILKRDVDWMVKNEYLAKADYNKLIFIGISIQEFDLAEIGALAEDYDSRVKARMVDSKDFYMVLKDNSKTVQQSVLEIRMGLCVREEWETMVVPGRGLVNYFKKGTELRVQDHPRPKKSKKLDDFDLGGLNFSWPDLMAENHNPMRIEETPKEKDDVYMRAMLSSIKFYMSFLGSLLREIKANNLFHEDFVENSYLSRGLLWSVSNQEDKYKYFRQYDEKTDDKEWLMTFYEHHHKNFQEIHWARAQNS
jgi:hypothetical protein